MSESTWPDSPYCSREVGPYSTQLAEACEWVNRQLELAPGRLVYQSRSGPPSQPWLEPDICEYLRELHAAGEVHDIVVAPIGFLSDHLEVVWDLNTEAKSLADSLGIHMVRSGTAGDHPRFVGMIRDLIQERIAGTSPPDCAPACCPPRRLNGRITLAPAYWGLSWLEKPANFKFRKSLEIAHFPRVQRLGRVLPHTVLI